MDASQPLHRREALKHAAGSATAALLASNPYFRIELQQRTNEILDFVMSERFLADLRAVLDSPSARQMEVAATRFDPKRLEQNGLVAPKGTRISSRVFDENSSRSRILGGAAKAPIGVDLHVPREKLTLKDLQGLLDKNLLATGSSAWGVCVCVGTGACVGVGGSS